ncbi:MAG TPA: winged helix-turn-helix domain-containing protein [Burkholderiaceae bacterium]|nr:winged helix-turn-helix domain-containing protein [Burkholderiaceae bacterium]
MEPYRFDRFEIRPAERQLLIDGEAAALGARAFDVLLALLERRERVVPKSELFDLVWPDTVVEENNLAVHVSALRRLLGRAAIVTVPGRGYRFTAPLHDSAETTEVARDSKETVELAARGATSTDARPAAPRLKTNLPDALPALIGRDDDVERVGALIARHRLVTIVGAGGIGKTLLAQHVLSRRRDAYAHGVGWVELAAVANAAQVVGAIAAALDVRSGSGDVAGLAAALAPLELMLALDNAEHLVDEVARIARALLEGAPGVRLLVTSQAPLRLAQEHLHRLGALAVPDADTLPPDEALAFGAVALFAERAQAAGRFELSTAHCADVIEIVRRLDGLPLTIELGAARVPLLGVQRLRAALDERLRVLTVGSRDAPARQRTLRATLEWSVALLDEREQIVFRRLAPVCGSASLELVQQLAADERIDEWAVVEALGGLVDRSLVAVSEGEPVRYRLLESPRALALERLREAGEQQALVARHAHAVAAMCERAYDEYFGGRIRVDDWRRAMEPDLDNARSAFAWARRHDARAAVAMMPELLLALPRQLVPERQALCDAIEPLLDAADVSLLSRARAAVEAALVVTNDRIPLGVALGRRALALARDAGDRRLLGMAWSVAAYGCAQSRDCSSTAREALRQLRELCDASWPPQVTRRVRSSEGLLLAAFGQFDDAIAALHRAARLDEQVGMPEPFALNNLAFIELLAGDFDAALRQSAETVARLRGTRHTQTLSLALSHLAMAWLEKGAAAQARVPAREGWSQATRFTHQALWADILAWLAARERRPRAAAQLAGYADAAYVRLQDARFDTQRPYDEALRIVRESLGDVDGQRLMAYGAALRDDQIEALAFGEQDDA